MKKHLRKRYFKILNKILMGLIIIFLLILLFGYIQDLLDKIDILVKYTDQQTSQIHNLEQELHNLESTNAKLEHTVTHQYQHIKELQIEGNTIKVDLRPRDIHIEPRVVSVPEDLHNEIDIKKAISDPSTITVTIITALSIVGKAISSLVPTLP